jgi:type VI secretion system secreted protein Hcp
MAASDIHLKIGDIKGESTDDKHKDEIDVESWAWGASNPGSISQGGAASAGRVTFTDLSFVHRMDKASPNLWKACATGQHFRDATLTSAKQGKGLQDFLIVKMTDVLVSSVSLSESNGAGMVPMEQVSMKFGKVDLEYKPQKADGSLDAGVHFNFDIKANKEG